MLIDFSIHEVHYKFTVYAGCVYHINTHHYVGSVLAENMLNITRTRRRAANQYVHEQTGFIVQHTIPTTFLIFSLPENHIQT